MHETRDGSVQGQGEVVDAGPFGHEAEVGNEHRVSPRKKTSSSQKSPCNSCRGSPAVGPASPAATSSASRSASSAMRCSADAGCQLLIRAAQPGLTPAPTLHPRAVQLLPDGLDVAQPGRADRRPVHPHKQPLIPRLTSRFRFRLPPRSRPCCRGIAHRATSTSHRSADTPARLPRRPPPASSTPGTVCADLDCAARMDAPHRDGP